MKSLLPFMLLLSTILLVSCGKEDVASPRASNDNLESRTPGNGIGNAPMQSGAFVFRFEYQFLGITIVDNKSNLVATFGYPDPVPAYCGGASPIDLVSTQEVLTGHPAGGIFALDQGEVHAKVREGPLDTEDLSQWCPYFSNAPVIAEGTVSMTGAYEDTSPKRQVYVLNCHGNLQSSEGETKTFSAHVLFSWDKDEDFNSIIELVQSYSVQLH